MFEKNFERARASNLHKGFMLVGSEVKFLMEKDSENLFLQQKYEIALLALKKLGEDWIDLPPWAFSLIEESLEEIENVGKDKKDTGL